MDTLIEALKHNKGKQELKSISSFLNIYVNNHFKYEESCMDMYKCPVACKNKNAHASFIENLQKIDNILDQSLPVEVVINMIKTQLLDWFVNHIKGIDIKLAKSTKK